jgi:phosphatidylglycerol lysyltransferase
LKRNAAGALLPVGFLSSQLLFSKGIEHSEGVSQRVVLAASGVFSAAGLLSLVIVVLPALGWMITKNLLPEGTVHAFILVSILLLILAGVLFNLVQHGRIYKWLLAKLPGLSGQLTPLFSKGLDPKRVMEAVGWSLGVELIGILHIWVAGRSLGLPVHFEMAIAGYLAVLAVLLVAPLLRGAGAVEALLAFVLVRYGLNIGEATAVAVLFRIFEFWGILLLAIPAFVIRSGGLLMRTGPSMLLFLLGAVNIVSGLTPAAPERVKWLREILPVAAIHASTALTVVAGLILLATAFWLLRGLRPAWWAAMLLGTLSLVGHLLKGIDYEEAGLAALTLLVLLVQQREYNARSDMRLMRRHWLPALAACLVLLALTALGFWLLDHRHFGADFSWTQALGYALQTFLMLNPSGLTPLTTFGGEFLGLLHLLAGGAWLLLAYGLFRPWIPVFEEDATDREKALRLIAQYGRSSLDYFKAYPDKHFFFSKNSDAFVAYKPTTRYALVLEDPVAPDALVMRETVREFDCFCRSLGLRSLYYRIPAASVNVYKTLGKSLMMLGEEAIVSLSEFTLEGKERKSLRNAVSRMEREGYRFIAHEPPLSGALLQQMRAVSDGWLHMLNRSEMSFSQGVFDEKTLKHQTVLTLEDHEGRILAFINLIPGANSHEANFDLMRRCPEAPSGAMDFLFAKMFLWLRDARKFTTCNLGLVPLSGMDHPNSFPETLLKLAYDRLPSFQAYKSLRFFKEKFAPEWQPRYVAYDSDLDLVNLPLVMKKAVYTP